MRYDTFTTDASTAMELQNSFEDFELCLCGCAECLITEEVINEVSCYWVSVSFPAWAETIFLIQFYKYSWDVMEGS